MTRNNPFTAWDEIVGGDVSKRRRNKTAASPSGAVFDENAELWLVPVALLLLVGGEVVLDLNDLLHDCAWICVVLR